MRHLGLLPFSLCHVLLAVPDFTMIIVKRFLLCNAFSRIRKKESYSSRTDRPGTVTYPAH